MPERVIPILTIAKRTTLRAIGADPHARCTSRAGKHCAATTPRSRFSQAADAKLLWIPLGYEVNIKSFGPLSNGEGPA
jgi:hypothetical protein